MSLDPRTPVLIGVGQVTDHAATMAEGREPSELMAEALTNAVHDAALSTIPTPDAIRVVSSLSWRYGSPSKAVGDRLGVTAREYGLTTDGGNSPQALVNLSSAEVLRGELDLAFLVGGESWRTRSRYRAADEQPPWTKQPEGTSPTRILGPQFSMTHPEEKALGLFMPVQIYPMFETAIRAAAGEDVEGHQVTISELWSRFSDVAVTNPYAWNRTPTTAEQIRTTGPRNRMIGFPYPKLMNSNNDVDQAAAVIICSVERATDLGVPRELWVFPHAGADCHEHNYISNRWTFTETPAIRIGGQATLELAGLTVDDIEVLDLYSCFPSAVQLGAQSLGIALDRQLTRTGGLSFAGGPWNNYVMHSIATVVSDLRERPDTSGMVWANGGYATKHSFGIYSTKPPAHGFRQASPQDQIDALPRRELAVPADAAGGATIEAYAVMHDRDNIPERMHATCLLADGRRAWGLSADRDVAKTMTDGEWVGSEVVLDADATLHLTT